MPDDRNPTDPTTDQDAMLDPEDVNSAPSAAAQNAGNAVQAEPDPNDEIPVPIAMSAAEIDERGLVVEALRNLPPSRAEPQAEA